MNTKINVAFFELLCTPLNREGLIQLRQMREGSHNAEVANQINLLLKKNPKLIHSLSPDEKTNLRKNFIILGLEKNEEADSSEQSHEISVIFQSIFETGTSIAVAASSGVLPGKPSVDPFHKFLQSVFKNEASAEVIETIIELLQKHSFTPKERSKILTGMRKIPKDENADIIEKAIPLLKEVANCEAWINILLAVQELPKDQRVSVIKMTLSLNLELKMKFSNFDSLDDIFKAMTSIPEGDERADVIEKTKSLIGEQRIVKDLENIIKEIQEIPRDERADIIENLKTLNINIPWIDSKTRIQFIKKIRSIPKDQIKDIINKAVLVSKRILNEHVSPEILDIIGRIPEGERENVIENLTFFSFNYLNPDQLEKNLMSIWYIPPIERTDVIQKAKLLTEGFFISGQTRGYVNCSFEAMLNEIRSIPEGEERDDVIKRVRNLLPKVSEHHKYISLGEINSILNVLKNMDRAERADIIETGAPFWARNDFILLIGYILEQIKSLPADQRLNIIADAAPLNALITNINLQMRVLHIFKVIPIEERAAVVEDVISIIPFFIESEHQEIFGLILETSIVNGIISQERRGDFIASLVKLFSRIKSDISKKSLLSAVKRIPLSETVDVIIKAAPNLYKLNVIQRESILLGLSTIPSEQRTDAIQPLINLFDGISERSDEKDILDALKEIPCNQIVNTIKKAQGLFQEKAEANCRIEILRAIQDIPQEKWPEISERARPFIQRMSSENFNAAILRATLLFPLEEKTEAIDPIDRLFRRISDRCLRVTLIQQMQRFSSEQRIFAIDRIEKLFRKISDVACRQFVINMIGATRTEEGVEKTIRLIGNLFEGITDQSDLITLQKAISVIVPNKICDVLEKAAPFIPQSSNAGLRTKIIWILSLIPARSRTDDSILTFINSFISTSEKTQDMLIEALEILPSAKVIDTIHLLNENDWFRMTNSLINELFEEYPNLIEMSKECLWQRLKNSMPHRELAAKLAKTLLAKQELLQINDEHHYAKTARLIGEITDPNRMSDPKNPYRFYRDLKRVVDNEPLWKPADLPSSRINGESFIFSLDSFRMIDIRAFRNDPPESELSDRFIRQYLFDHLVSIINHLIEYESTLNILNDGVSFQHKPNQIRYLKNRLSKQLNLSQTLSFDSNPQLVSDKILHKPLPELIKIIIRDITPDKLASSLHINLNKKLINNRDKFVSPCVDFFSKQADHDQDKICEWISLNRETGSHEISLKGSVVLLEHFGYIIKTSESKKRGHDEI